MFVTHSKRPGSGSSVRRLLIILFLALVCSLGGLYRVFVATAGPVVRSTPTQFVVIVFDDMRVDDMQYLPQLASLTEREGQSQNNAFIACPLCCPSRSSLMTGLCRAITAS